MNCKICGNNLQKIFRRCILNKYEIDYYNCTYCKFIQTEEPYWLEEAYKYSISINDTGIIKRNLLFAKRTAAVIIFFFNRKGCFVDFGGGTGLFVRIMRDYGFDFYWNDPYSQNIFARGFEYDEAKHKNIELVTAFECFEHFINPIEEIDRMLSISKSILFSTVPFNDEVPDPDSWEYYSFMSGQHISFYSLSSLSYIAKKFNLNFYTNRKSFHLFCPKSINNTLYNVLLKSSILTMPIFLKLWMKTKTYSDIELLSRFP